MSDSSSKKKHLSAAERRRENKKRKQPTTADADADNAMGTVFTLKAIYPTNVPPVDKFTDKAVYISACAFQFAHKFVFWAKPKRGCFSMHTDAMISESGFIYIAAVLRDSDGKLLYATVKNFGLPKRDEDNTSRFAELQGLSLGLTVIQERGMANNNITVSCDCSEAVTLIEKDIRPKTEKSLLRKLQSKLENYPNVRINHVLRESNYVADSLTKHAAQRRLIVADYNNEEKLAFLADFLQKDRDQELYPVLTPPEKKEMMTVFEKSR